MNQFEARATIKAPIFEVVQVFSFLLSTFVFCFLLSQSLPSHFFCSRLRFGALLARKRLSRLQETRSAFFSRDQLNEVFV